MAITKAIKGALVPAEEISSSFIDPETGVEIEGVSSQLVDLGIISPREGGAQFEFLQDFDVAGFTPTTKAPTEEAETAGGTEAGDVFSFLESFVGGADEEEVVTPETEAGLEIKRQEEEVAETERVARQTALTAGLETELTNIDTEGEALRGETTNKLAQLGILGNSTAGVQFLTDLTNDINRLKSETRTKFQIESLDIDAEIKAKMTEAIDERIVGINKAIQDKRDSLLEQGKLGVALFSALNTAEQDRISNELEAEKNKLQEDFNNKKISVDVFNAETKRIESEISAFEAQTARQKEEREAGEVRPSYSEFLQAYGNQTNQTVDPNNPEIQALYNQAFPITVSEAKKSLTTEQESRSEVVQDMIDKKEITLEEAQQIHPDISWKFHRPGLSALERTIFSFSGIDG